MTDAEFEARVRELEERSAAHPKRFMARVVALAVLGYGYVVGVLLVTAGLLAACLWGFATGHGNIGLIKITVALGTLFVLIVGALWVRMTPPEGREVTEAEAPKLHEAIERLRAHVPVPKLRKVLLTDDFNASVYQHPRLGILGGYQNYLMLGVPLMAALSPRQLDAVLAHEFGHLSGSHGKLGAWLYRIRGSWFALEQALEKKKSWGGWIFRGFMRRYFPTFNAHTFVLARAHEYDADRASARAVSARDAADALIALRIRGAFLGERFWPSVFRTADDEPEPSARPYARLLEELPKQTAAADSMRALHEALGETTGVADTHPCLTDRLAALGEEPRVPPPLEVSAAAAYLGRLGEALAGELDRAWSQHVGEAWKDRFATAEGERKRLAALEADTATRALTPDESWERASLTESRRGLQAAAPLYEAFADAHPDFAPAHFARGRILLAQGDDEGLHLLERAMTLDPDAIVPACSIAVPYLRSRGRHDAAAEFESRLRVRGALLEKARSERAHFRSQGPFEHHGLPEAAIDALRKELSPFPEVAEAWLVRQATEHLPESPLFVLVVRRKPKWLDLGKQMEAFHTQLAQNVGMPGPGFIVLANRLSRAVSDRVTGVPGTRIWPLSQ